MGKKRKGNINYILARKKAAETQLARRTGWAALGYEIVHQAIKDYKAKYTSYTELKRIREFFHSNRFQRFTVVDPDYALQRLDKYRREHGYVVIDDNGHRVTNRDNTDSIGIVDITGSKKG